MATPKNGIFLIIFLRACVCFRFSIGLGIFRLFLAASILLRHIWVVRGNSGGFVCRSARTRPLRFRPGYGGKPREASTRESQKDDLARLYGRVRTLPSSRRERSLLWYTRKSGNRLFGVIAVAGQMSYRRGVRTASAGFGLASSPRNLTISPSLLLLSPPFVDRSAPRAPAARMAARGKRFFPCAWWGGRLGTLTACSCFACRWSG